ncbi:MAG: hypothetical protein IKO93_18565, partial [Lentisphaeria bacterium]|nr:hypothetical protein [Lentisphaeria bacterium]
MKTILSVFLAVLAVALCGFDFAADGKPLCSIVYPDQPGQLEKMAAEDLQSFLSRISGAGFV